MPLTVTSLEHKIIVGGGALVVNLTSSRDLQLKFFLDQSPVIYIALVKISWRSGEHPKIKEENEQV